MIKLPPEPDWHLATAAAKGEKEEDTTFLGLFAPLPLWLWGATGEEMLQSFRDGRSVDKPGYTDIRYRKKMYEDEDLTKKDNKWGFYF